jgi:hypothetical protein
MNKMRKHWSTEEKELLWKLKKSKTTNDEIRRQLKEKFGVERNNPSINSMIYNLKKGNYDQVINIKNELPQLSEQNCFRELYELDNTHRTEREELIESYLLSERNQLNKLDKSYEFQKLGNLSIEEALSMGENERSRIIDLLKEPERKLITPTENTIIGLIKVPDYDSETESNKLILPAYSSEIKIPSKKLVSIVHDVSLDILNKDADIKEIDSFKNFVRYQINSDNLDWQDKSDEITKELMNNYAKIGLKILEDRQVYKN